MERCVTEGLARFYVVTTGLEWTMLPKWNSTISKAEVREDRRGFSFVLIDFHGIPDDSRQRTKRMSFYNPFIAKFMEYKLPDMMEPYVWV